MSAVAIVTDSVLIPDDLRRSMYLMVSEIMKATKQEEKLHASIMGYSQESATAVACQSLRSGIFGSGNSGTKGVGSKGWLDPEPANDRSLYLDWRQTLSGELLLTHEAIADDGTGYGLMKEYPFGGKYFDLTLEQRIALRRCTSKVVKNWEKHVALKDSQVFIVGSQINGEGFLLELAKSFHEYR